LAAQEGVADVVKRSSDAVVLIVISNSAGQETALGSGFLISADGQIITNYHVVKEARSAIVKLSNGAFFPVNSIVASDADKDLAIIKVNGRNLPFLQIGDVEGLHVGDHVVAIGSPLGLEGTVSDGIVSALRDIGKTKWIQTTAPVSHGNSGGPLLDMSNHVVGVITWGVNLQLGQNLNFAAPANEVTALLSGPTPVMRSLSPTSLPESSGIQRLKDVRKIALESLGNSDAAGLVREKLINRLTASGRLTVVEDSSDADAVLTGAVGANVYGRADAAAIRLVTRDGRTLWGSETRRGWSRSASSSVADRLAKELLTAITRDETSVQAKQ
jgi:S1-C subfamily serine protease